MGRPRGLAYYSSRGMMPSNSAPLGLPPAKGLAYFTSHSALGDLTTPADVAQAAPATQYADAALQDKIMDGVAPGPEQGGSPNVPSPAAPPPGLSERSAITTGPVGSCHAISSASTGPTAGLW